LAPCLAGLVVNAAVNDRLNTALSGGAMLAYLPLHTTGHVLNAPLAVRISLPIVLGLIGGIPALRHLRGPGPVAER
jgi:hypothetical protein